MENRYLFKAKRLDNGEWVQGCYIYDVERDCGESLNEFAHRIQPLYANAYAEPIDPSTICQCTGLKDMHGNLIWENDIVKGKYYDGGKAYEHMGQIEYDCQSYKVVGINQYKGYYAELDSLYETVGNIFDNPEFIEEREDIELD